jgi:AraC family transcriptional regulator of adaptative response/methylated-DNA-[protein]-cysteine methyltransferase
MTMSKVEDTRVFADIGETSLGLILLISGEQGIRRLRFADHEGELRAEQRERYPDAVATADSEFRSLFQRVISQIESPEPQASFALDPFAIDPFALDLSGTPFQRSVWQALTEIPIGTTASYSQIASQIGRPSSMRAVANACGDNPIAVLVPCHRVVRSDGGLGGYRWGLERKRALLEREASVACLAR